MVLVYWMTEFPTRFYLGEAAPVLVRVSNRTKQHQVASYFIADSKAFLVAGKKNFTFEIMPESELEICIKLLGIMIGQHSLPTIRVECCGFVQDLSSAGGDDESSTVLVVSR